MQLLIVYTNKKQPNSMVQFYVEDLFDCDINYECGMAKLPIKPRFKPISHLQNPYALGRPRYCRAYFL